MNLKLISIRRLDANRYEVQVESAISDRTFVLSVEDGDIQVVTWTPEFAAFVSHNFGPAEPLMQAVLAVHRAQNLSFP